MWKSIVEEAYIDGMGQYRGHYYKIYHVTGHYELYINGEFWSSGDSYREIKDELEEVKLLGAGPF